MKYYLLTETQYFYDGHGSPDEGSIDKSVVTSEDYPDIDPLLQYYEDYDSDTGLTAYTDDYDEEDFELYAQDGYNCTRTDYKFKEIQEFEVHSIKTLIEKYDAL